MPDGVIGYGEYDGVRVGIIKTDGKIGTIFPDADLQPQRRNIYVKKSKRNIRQEVENK